MQANIINPVTSIEMEMNEEYWDKIAQDNLEFDDLEPDIEGEMNEENGDKIAQDNLEFDNLEAATASSEITENDSLPNSEQMLWHPDWTDEERKKLEDHLNYANAYYNVMCELIQSGSSNNEIPKKPKSNLADFVLAKKKASSKLTDKKLHIYLFEKIVDESSSSVWMPDVSIIKEDITMNEIIEHLKKAHEYVRVKERNMFCVYLDYGEWLEALAVKFKKEKDVGIIKETWTEWLKNKVDITDSYVRKLRLLSKMFKHHTKFRSLSITFTEMYKRRAEITQKSSLEYDSIWKNG